MPRQKETTRKSVFFIVEGNTDKTALEKIFKTIYKYKDIRFEFTNGWCLLKQLNKIGSYG